MAVAGSDHGGSTEQASDIQRVYRDSTKRDRHGAED